LVKLREDKTRLELRLHNHGTELNASKLEVRRLEVELANAVSHLRSKSELLDRIRSQKLPFLDVTDPDKNSLNVPSHDQKVVRWFRNFLESVLVHCERTAQALAGFYGHYEKRAPIVHKTGAVEVITGNFRTMFRLVHRL
jgi:hypothetical protein